MPKFLLIFFLVCVLALASCGAESDKDSPEKMTPENLTKTQKLGLTMSPLP
jgi:hypothetical protein